MASIQKYRKGWRVFIKRKGISKTATFETKREAQEWATKTEALLLSEMQGIRKRPFREFLTRYFDDVLAHKNAPWEDRLVMRLLKDPIADVVGIDETAAVAYRDARLKKVQGATVNREMTLLSSVCSIAVREWKWLDKNPFFEVRKPKMNPPRERRITDEEIAILEKAAGYGFPLVLKNQKVIHAFHFAIETAMRANEIASLTWDNIDLEKRTAFLPMTKNGTSRTVPLSRRAVELLEHLPRVGRSVFGIPNIPATFIRVKSKTDIKDLHFHDTRHEAITRLSKKLDVLALARMVGHKNIKQLMTYYNESPEDIALRL